MKHRYVPPKPKVRHRHIAPRLTDGLRRQKTGASRDPLVHAGLAEIARAEGQSISWVEEQVFIDYFGLRHSPYAFKPKATLFEPKKRKGAA